MWADGGAGPNSTTQRLYPRHTDLDIAFRISMFLVIIVVIIIIIGIIVVVIIVGITICRALLFSFITL